MSLSALNVTSDSSSEIRRRLGTSEGEREPEATLGSGS